jgi:hypothetical protein
VRVCSDCTVGNAIDAVLQKAGVVLNGSARQYIALARSSPAARATSPTRNALFDLNVQRRKMSDEATPARLSPSARARSTQTAAAASDRIDVLDESAPLRSLGLSLDAPSHMQIVMLPPPASSLTAVETRARSASAGQSQRAVLPTERRAADEDAATATMTASARTGAVDSERVAMSTDRSAYNNLSNNMTQK